MASESETDLEITGTTPTSQIRAVKRRLGEEKIRDDFRDEASRTVAGKVEALDKRLPEKFDGTDVLVRLAKVESIASAGKWLAGVIVTALVSVIITLLFK